MKQLLLCAGPSKPEGFTTLDADPRHEPDIVASLPAFKLGKIGSEPWDRIALIHGIEHFEEWEARDIVKDIWSVLAIGGTLTLEQPNLEATAKAILGLDRYTMEWERDTVWAIYGDPSRRQHPGMAHKFGYTPATLRALLYGCGFAQDQITTPPITCHIPGRDFRMDAVKT